MKVKMNMSKANKLSATGAGLFYVGYCFVGYSPDLPVNVFQYWLDSALFLDGKMAITLSILFLPYVKAFVEGTFLNNKDMFFAKKNMLTMSR